jgi:hypothetical protein
MLNALKLIRRFYRGTNSENWNPIHGKLTNAKQVPSKQKIDALFDVLALVLPLSLGLILKNTEYVMPKTAANTNM